ncbi:hypothetical protein FCE95_08175 [Luteimonas gilva]|uniref:Uncharacterized protein n=1 Tax=Luteimonas gilva TaxID=2572684 RepID=A0A4U5JKP0_9GAMM|nr:hypothetical protein [Luteimonas gilva]TKR30112.1 hypothetical protein FCE95_08175 [Luteimonas gilva]
MAVRYPDPSPRDRAANKSPLMAARPRSDRRPVSDAEVRFNRNGYSLLLRSEGRLSPVREGRRVRRWPDLDRAIAFLVKHYGALPVRLRLRGTRTPTPRAANETAL